MRETFDVYLQGANLPVAVNLTEDEAVAVDLNLTTLTRQEATSRSSVRSNPARAALAAIDTEISKVLGAVPVDANAAKAFISDMAGLDRAAKARLFGQVKKLYDARKEHLAPAFAKALTESLADNLAENQDFFVEEGVVERIIASQVSQFGDDLSMGSGATYERLSAENKELVVQLLLFIQAFVDINDDIGTFRDSEFFIAFATLSPTQVRQLLRLFASVKFDDIVGAHYASGTILTMRALSILEGKKFLSTLKSFKVQPNASYKDVFGLLGALEFTAGGTSPIPASDYKNISGSIQNAVSLASVNLSIRSLMTTKDTEGAMDSSDLTTALRTAGVIAAGANVSSLNPLQQVMLFSKAMFDGIPDMDVRGKVLDQAQLKKAGVPCFEFIKSKLVKPVTIDPDSIFINYISAEVYDDGGDETTNPHYITWACNLYSTAYSNGGIEPTGGYSSTSAWQRDKELCRILTGKTAEDKRALQNMISLIEKRPRIVQEALTEGRMSSDSETFTNGGRGTVLDKFPRHLYDGLSKAETHALSLLDQDSDGKRQAREGLVRNVILAATQIENPYDLKQFAYEIVELNDGSGDFGAISTPFNPLEQISGYSTISSCCMRPFNVGTSASIASFYGAIQTVGMSAANRRADKDRVVTAYALHRESDGTVQSYGTMYLPVYNITYNTDVSRTSADPAVELVAGPTEISLNSIGVAPIYPGTARSYDGPEAGASEWSQKKGIANSSPIVAPYLLKVISASSIGWQMGIHGDSGEAFKGELESIPGSIELRNPGSYTDARHPKATKVLEGIVTVSDPDTFFTETEICATSDKDVFIVAYKGVSPVDGRKLAVSTEVSLEYLKYMLSFPKLANFVTLEGALKFRTHTPGDEEIFVSIYVPAWFDSCDERPLERGGKKLRKADIIEMRTPKNGVFIDGRRIDN